MTASENSWVVLVIEIFFQGMSGDGMIPSNGMAVPQGQVMIPNYSVFSGTPSHIVNMKSRTSIPNYLAENELKADILKRQQISHAQVSFSWSQFFRGKKTEKFGGGKNLYEITAWNRAETGGNSYKFLPPPKYLCIFL